MIFSPGHVIKVLSILNTKQNHTLTKGCFYFTWAKMDGIFHVKFSKDSMLKYANEW